MKRKTTRTEVIEEFDDKGNLRSRTTINEAEEEDETCKTSSCNETYWSPTISTTGYIEMLNNPQCEGQINIEEYTKNSGT